MKTKTFEVDSIEEALTQASIEFGISEEELIEKIISDKNENGKMEVEITVCIDPVEKAKRYINQLLENNNVEGMLEKRVRDEAIEFNIDAGEFNGVLIGRNSHHLIALQTLVSSMINQYYNEDEQMVVKIDVGGYRRRRESHLERMAVDFAKQVMKTKQVIKLDNLNSYERKIIHDRLSNWKGISTHSEGETPNRVLYIESSNKSNKE